MKIHEYQARELLRAAGIPVPPGRMIQSVEEAAAAFKETTAGMARPLAVVKAQVHAGGRGKAGFVKLVGTAEEAVAAARFMLSTRMRSPQTPPEGLEVTRLLVAQAVEIADRPPSRGAPGRAGSADGAGKEEFYLAITTDRGTRRNVLIASRQGGVDIEQVAHDDPGTIL